jgi:hypothetical protein
MSLHRSKREDLGLARLQALREEVCEASRLRSTCAWQQPSGTQARQAPLHRTLALSYMLQRLRAGRIDGQKTGLAAENRLISHLNRLAAQMLTSIHPCNPPFVNPPFVFLIAGYARRSGSSQVHR